MHAVVLGPLDNKRQAQTSVNPEYIVFTILRIIWRDEHKKNMEDG